MNKKILAVLLASVMALASACSVSSGSGSSEATPPASQAPSASEAAPAPDAAPSEAAPEEAQEPAAEADEWASKLGAKTFPAIAKEDLKIGFIYIGNAGDIGYTYAHDQGRKAMMEAIGLSEDQVLVVNDVPEDNSCEEQIRNLIDQGCNMIFTTSFGFMDWTVNAAKEFPDVMFMHCSGYKYGENMSAYFGRMYEMRYVSGIVAGLKAKEQAAAGKENKLGYVAAMPTAEVIRGANAFALGVKSVNPEAKMEVKFTNSWFDPAVEKQVAMDLLNGGACVLGQHCDTTAPQVAAQDAGAFAVGYNAATYENAPKAYLTSPLWNWGVYCTQQVQDAIDGKWKSSNYWGHMTDGIVSLDALSPNCTADAQAAVDAAMKGIESGELQVFAGPLTDNQGAERVAEGQVMTDEEMLSMDWFVDNIIGSVPQA